MTFLGIGCILCVMFGGLFLSASAFDNVNVDVDKISVQFQDKDGRTITPGTKTLLNPSGFATRLQRGNIAIDLDLEVQNKNPLQLDVQKVTYKVYINDKYVGKGRRPRKGKASITIPARAFHTTTVTVKTPTKKIFAKTSSVLTRGKLNIVVKGHAKTSVLGVNLTRSFKVKHTHNFSPVKGLSLP